MARLYSVLWKKTKSDDLKAISHTCPSSICQTSPKCLHLLLTTTAGCSNSFRNVAVDFLFPLTLNTGIPIEVW